MLQEKQDYYKMNLQSKYLLDVLSGKKSIEARLFRDKHTQIGKDDEILFKDKSGLQSALCKVLEAIRYGSFYEMLQFEGLEKCLPGIKTISEGVSVYHSFPSYKVLEFKTGVIAFRLECI